MGKARRNKKTSPAPGEFIILKNMQSSDEEANGKRSVGTATDIQMKSRGNQTDHVVIQMPENVDDQIEHRDHDAGNDTDDVGPAVDDKSSIFSFSFAYMATHFDFMKRTGMLHVRKNNRTLSWKSALHLIVFGVNYILALIWELGRGKDYMLSRKRNKKTSVFYIITIWFYFHTAFVSMFFMKLVIQNAISKFFSNVESIKEKRSKSKNNDEKLSKVSKLTIGLAIINILITGYMASGANLMIFRDYDHEDILIYRTSQFQERLLYWQKSDYSIPLDRANNATELETEHVIYGSAEIGLRLVGWFHYMAMKDTVLVSALTLYSYTNEFKDFLDQTKNEPITLPLLGTLSYNWEILHLISFEIESQFGGLFNMIAIDNWLTGSYTLLGFMRDEFKFDGYFIVNIYIMSKSLIAYILAAIARKTAPMLKRRLYTNSPPVESTDEMDVAIKRAIGDFERKIDNTSVGMGTGNFHVDENYVYKYIGSVLSSSVVFMDHQKKDKEA